jgi:hypothetical protein
MAAAVHQLTDAKARIGADCFRARGNPDDHVSWSNVRKRLLTCAVGRPSLTVLSVVSGGAAPRCAFDAHDS